MTPKGEFDDVLHEALSEYRDAEPLTGIESRLLERLETRSDERLPPWLRWGIPAACAIALVLAIWAGKMIRTPRSSSGTHAVAAQPDHSPQNAQLPAASEELPQVAAKASRQRALSVRAVPASGTVLRPMPDQFPAPTPLNSEERAFMAALDNQPHVHLPAESNQLGAIAQIEIKPLSVSNDAPGEKQ